MIGVNGIFVGFCSFWGLIEGGYWIECVMEKCVVLYWVIESFLVNNYIWGWVVIFMLSDVWFSFDFVGIIIL